MKNNFKNMMIQRIKEGKTADEIRIEFGTSNSYPYALAKREGLSLKRTRGKKTVNGKPITDLHIAIGRKLFWERLFMKEEEIKEAAANIGITTTKLNQIEKGTYDLSLLYLIKLAYYYKMEVWELIKFATEQMNEKELN